MLRVLIAMVLIAKSGFAQSRPSSYEKQLFELVNQDRARSRLAPLEWNEAIAQVARVHARLLLQHRALSHQFPGEAVLFDRLGALGLRFDVAAENAAAGNGVRANHESLMRSPGHRANLLSREFNSIGIGIVESNDIFYITEDFAHVLPTFSEAEFREALVAAFNEARRNHGNSPVKARLDDRLREAACAKGGDTQTLADRLPGVFQVAAFTASDPASLSPPMVQATRSANIRRLSLGVCFRPGGAQGFANFWVVAAFYTSD
jgi:uncharacterized protein YkwD